MVLLLEPAAVAVWWVDREPADLDQRFHHELLPFYQSTVALSAQHCQRSQVLAMPAALATVAVVVYVAVALVNTEMAVPLAAFDLLAESIVAASVPSG